MGANISKFVGTAASVSITIIVEIMLRKLIRRNKTILALIKTAQWVRCGDMGKHDYACVQGVLGADGGKALEQEIMLWKPSTMIKIIWSLILSNFTGRWSDTENLRNLIPFHLEVEKWFPDGPSMKIFVTDPSKATFMMRGLRLVIKPAINKAENGKATLGLVLPTETWLIFGKVTPAADGRITIGPSANTEWCYILTLMKRKQLFEFFEDKIRFLEFLANSIIVIGGGAIAIIAIYMIWSYFRRKSNAKCDIDGSDVAAGRKEEVNAKCDTDGSDVAAGE